MKYGRFLCGALCALVVAAFSGCGRHNTPEITSLDELNDKRRSIGYNEGQSSGFMLPEVFPQAQVKSFTDKLSGYEALRQGKIDAFAFDRVQMELAIENGLSGVKILSRFGNKVEVGVGISPAAGIPDLESKVNAFLDSLRADGTLDGIKKHWVQEKNEVMPDIPAPASPTVHLRIGTSGVVPPYSYFKGTELTGMDIELIKRFASYLNADYEIKVYDYGSIVAAAISGDIDCIFANLNKTPERAEAIIFSTPIYTEENAILVRDASTATASASGSAAKARFTRLTDFNKPSVTLGVRTGTMFDVMTEESFPLAKTAQLNTTPDMVLRTLQGEMDGFLADEPTIRYIESENPEITYLKELLEPQDYGFIFPKTARGEKLRDQMNSFLSEISADGTLLELDSLWFSDSDAKKKVDLNGMSGANGTITLAIDSATPPFAYVLDNAFAGYEVDIAARFCKKYGYALKIVDTQFGSVMAGIVSGTYDMGAACITITAERAQKVHFSDADYHGGVAMAVAKSRVAPEATIAGSAGSAYTTLADLNKSGVNIGVQTGTTFGDLVPELFPKAAAQYYTANTDMAHLVAMGKLDALLVDEPVAKSLCANIGGIDYIKDYVEKAEFAFALPKTGAGERLQSQLDMFIIKAKNSGLVEELEDIWFGDDESRKVIDMSGLTGENGTLSLATNAEYAPFEYIQDGKIIGYDIDWAVRFAREYGYKLDIVDMNFDAIITSVASGRYDFAVSGISVTEERKESVHFSRPNYSGGAVAVVRTDVPAQGADKKQNTRLVLSSLASSFEKTFVRESRWKLIVHGIGVTVLISLFAALFGTGLGFGFCAFRLSKNRLLDTLALIYIRVMQGLPMVVLLMILFYIVFAKSGLNGIWVAVIGFGMNFGAYVSEMIRTGILAVDKGQTEAALALGYPKARAFLKVVLPQAARHFLPVYQGEFISLVKMTSIVGYIAIQDLTKAGDIIRSRTYEAFFPLFTTAVIYFVIAWLLTRVLSVLQTRLDPKKRRNRRISTQMNTDARG